MNRQGTVADRVIETVSQMPGCLLEEVVVACPDLSWNQVFLEVDRLSRDGRIRLTSKGMGRYVLQPGETEGAMFTPRRAEPGLVRGSRRGSGTVHEAARPGSQGQQGNRGHHNKEASR